MRFLATSRRRQVFGYHGCSTSFSFIIYLRYVYILRMHHDLYPSARTPTDLEGRSHEDRILLILHQPNSIPLLTNLAVTSPL